MLEAAAPWSGPSRSGDQPIKSRPAAFAALASSEGTILPSVSSASMHLADAAADAAHSPSSFICCSRS
jgi:hypothetical protein